MRKLTFQYDLSLNTINLAYKLNHSTFKVKDLRQVPQHFFRKESKLFFMVYKQGPAWCGSFSLISYCPLTPSLTEASGALASFLFVEHTKSYPHPGPCTCGVLSTYFSVLSPDITSLWAFTGHRLENDHLFHHSTYWNCHNLVINIWFFFLMCGLCYCLSHPYLECEVIPSLNSSVVPTNLAQCLAYLLTGSRT